MPRRLKKPCLNRADKQRDILEKRLKAKAAPAGAPKRAAAVGGQKQKPAAAATSNAAVSEEEQLESEMAAMQAASAAAEQRKEQQQAIVARVKAQAAELEEARAKVIVYHA